MTAPGKQGLERNLMLYKVLALFQFTPFMLPVIVLFWGENGMDMFDIYLLQGIFAVFIVILEVPTGMVADRIGKRVSLLMGLAFLILGIVVYALGHGFFAFLWAELILALGAALMSGSGSALLYDTLKTLGRESEYQRLEGEARSMMMVSFAVCNLLGGVVAHTVSLRATVWLTVAGPVIGLFTSLGFREVQAVRATKSLRTEMAAYLGLIRDSLKFVRKQRLVRWHIQFFAVLGASSTWLLWLYQPYMSFCGLPLWSFGMIFALFNFFAAYMSRVAHRVSGRFGEKHTLTLLMGLQIVSPLLMSFIVTPLSFIFILGHQAVRAFMVPVVQDRVLRYTYADKRATVLSLCALSNRLFFALTAPLIGVMSNTLTMPANLAGQGGILILVLGGLYWSYGRIPAKYFSVKRSPGSYQEKSGI